MGNRISRVFAPMGRLITRACTAASRFWTGNTTKENTTKTEVNSSIREEDRQEGNTTKKDTTTTEVKSSIREEDGQEDKKSVVILKYEKKKISKSTIPFSDSEKEFLKQKNSLILTSIKSYFSCNKQLLENIKKYNESHSDDANIPVFTLNGNGKISEISTSSMFLVNIYLLNQGHPSISYLTDGKILKFSRREEHVFLLTIDGINLLFSTNKSDLIRLKDTTIFEQLSFEQQKAGKDVGRRRRHSSFKKFRQISKFSRKRH